MNAHGGRKADSLAQLVSRFYNILGAVHPAVFDWALQVRGCW